MTKPTDIPEIDIKVTVTEIKADPNRKPRTWSCYEILEDGSVPDYDAKVLQATEAADKYRTHHVVHYEDPDEISYDSIEVLGFLVGRPWDQFALNYVHSVRPSGIRVIRPMGTETCDAQTWRVTVYLADDDRTTREIRQEVGVGCVGAKHGHGLRRYRIGESPEPVLCYSNLRGIKKLEIYK